MTLLLIGMTVGGGGQGHTTAPGQRARGGRAEPGWLDFSDRSFCINKIRLFRVSAGPVFWCRRFDGPRIVLTAKPLTQQPPVLIHTPCGRDPFPADRTRTRPARLPLKRGGRSLKAPAGVFRTLARRHVSTRARPGSGSGPARRPVRRSSATGAGKDKPMLVGLETDFNRVRGSGRDRGRRVRRPRGCPPARTTRPPPTRSPRRCGRALSGYRIEIESRNGVVTLTGWCRELRPSGLRPSPAPRASWRGEGDRPAAGRW